MVVVAQLGARMHYAVPAILARSGMLERLYTDIYAPPLPRPLRRLASRIGPAPLRRWLGRVPTGIPASKITSFPVMGLEYYRRLKYAADPEAMTAAVLSAGSEICRRAIECGLGNARCVYTFNSAGLELLRFAEAHGLCAVMEQTFAPEEIYQETLREEQEAHPGWAASSAWNRLTPAYEEREQMEWSCADLILCGSEFVRDGIRAKGGPVERCRVAPYGVRPPSSIAERNRLRKPIRVLTAGTVGLRKGAPYIASAAQILKRKAEFRVVGPLDVTPHAQKLLGEHVALLGAVPRTEIHRQFAWADVFLLPTLCEGSATVCYEALSYGLPVITTPNAGSVVRDGVDGFIVPIRDAPAIADCVERLVDDGDLWAAMSANALARAREYTLERYGERLVDALEDAGVTARSMRPEINEHSSAGAYWRLN
jgi:glycosyltransferase involved in cell wall biosynthesis